MHLDAEAGERQVCPKNKLMVGSDERERAGRKCTSALSDVYTLATQSLKSVHRKMKGLYTPFLPFRMD